MDRNLKFRNDNVREREREREKGKKGGREKSW